MQQELNDHEVSIKDLMDKGQKLIKDVESNGGSTEDLSSLVDNLSSGLADVKEKSDNRNQNIVSSMKHGKRFQDLLSNLVLALKINEEKLEKMNKPKADTEDVSKKLKEARVRISLMPLFILTAYIRNM